MFDWAKLPKMLDHLKGRYFFVLALVAFLVLIAPDAVSTRLGFDALLEDRRAYVGVILIGASLLWLVNVATWIVDRVNTRQIASKRREALERDLSSLARLEMFLLLFALARNTRTVYLPHGDSIALALGNKGLLEPASGQGDGTYWPHLIPDYVWDHLISQREQLLENARSNDPDLDMRFNWFEDFVADPEPFKKWPDQLAF